MIIFSFYWKWKKDINRNSWSLIVRVVLLEMSFVQLFLYPHGESSSIDNEGLILLISYLCRGDCFQTLGKGKITIMEDSKEFRKGIHRLEW